MRPAQIVRLLTVVGFLSAAGIGCARYEYDILRPSEAATHVGKQADAIVRMEPLEYRLRTVDNRLVIRIFNPTDDMISLLGDRSVAVDPYGQSHPLPSFSIASNSYGKLIIPPPRPQVEPRGPVFGIGVGTRIGSRTRGGSADLLPASPADTSQEPKYLRIYDEGNNLYWDWTGEGEVRLRLVYRRNDREFADEFVIARKKM